MSHSTLQHLYMAMDMIPLDGEHARTNRTLWGLRDRLFHMLFKRATLAYAGATSQLYRTVMETSLLFMAVLCLFTLGYVHANFVQVPVTCLDNEVKTWSREGVLRVKIASPEPSLPDSQAASYCNQDSPPIKKINPERQKLLNSAKTTQAQVVKASAPTDMQDTLLDEEKVPEFINKTHHRDSVSDPDCLSPLRTTLSDIEMFTNTVWPQEDYIVEYSVEFGFLRLSPGARQNASIKVHTVTLDPETDACFGNPLSQFLLKHLIGYDDVLMGSLKYLVDKDDSHGKGFVRNVVTGNQYRFVDKNTTWTSYFSAAFFMLVFTLSISMLLRYSHHQIFMFIVELLHVLEYNVGITIPAAPLMIVILALVGMEAIMSEFFNDSSTAFYIILTVWLADQYDTVCCHTAVSKKHWLRFFFVYHFAFYAYHYRFNGQYTNLALTASWLFIQHSMLFFFHRFEMPAVLQSEPPLFEIDNSFLVEAGIAPNLNEQNEAEYLGDDENNAQNADAVPGEAVAETENPSVPEPAAPAEEAPQPK